MQREMPRRFLAALLFALALPSLAQAQPAFRTYFGDFDADGRTDIIVARPDGSSTMWLMSGAAVRAIRPFHPSGYNPQAYPTADLNGDGKADVLSYSLSSGPFSPLGYLMDGTRFIDTVMYGSGTMEGTGDFNGDGKADFLWRYPGFPLELELRDATPYLVGGRALGELDSAWRVEKIADFNGDGKSDVVWHHDDGRSLLWLMDGTTVTGTRDLQAVASPWRVVQTPDLNGDGRADLVWHNPDGRTVLWLMNGTTLLQSLTVQPTGSPWRIVQAGDVNGDGRDDLAWRHRDTGAVELWLMNGVSSTASQVVRIANAFFTPELLGIVDLDGDGKGDLVWSNGPAMDLWLMNGLQATQQVAIPDLASPPVAGADSTTVVTSSLNPATWRDSYRLTATVTSAGGTPSGDVAFKADGVAIEGCASRTLAAGVATCDISLASNMLLPGERTISVTFTGNAGLIAASTGTLVQVVNRTASTTQLTLPSAPAAGQAIRLEAKAFNESFIRLDGRFRFLSGGVAIPGCESVQSEGGFAYCSTVYYTAGNYEISAQFDGTIAEAPSSSAPATLEVLGPSVPPPSAMAWKRSDFNLDGKEDIVWRLPNRETKLWLMYTNESPNSQNVNAPFANRQLAFTGDTGGLSRATELLWRYDDGSVEAWERQPGGGFNSSILREAGSGWTPQQVGDVNGDGRADIAWKHADGRVELTGLFPRREIQPAGSPFNVTHMADFDGDARSDILWRAADGRVILWLMQETFRMASLTLQPAGGTATVALTPDLNGDGKADIVWQDADGSVRLGLMNGVNQTSSAVVLPAGSWRPSHAGDFNGDGKADLLFTHADGRVVLWLMDGVTRTELRTLRAAGSGWSVAQVGDFDGDGKADIAWLHANASQVEVWKMDGTATVTADPLTITSSPPRIPPSPTTTTLASSLNPSTAGQSVTFTAMVTVQGGAVPTGIVHFLDGETVIPGCFGMTVAAGAATCTTASLSGGARSIFAAYAGTPDQAPSRSATLSQVVYKAPSAITLTQSAPSSLIGDATFRAVVTSPLSPLSGTVQFSADGLVIVGCNAVPLVGGAAECIPQGMRQGSRAVFAFYSGDESHLNSASNVLTHEVTAGPPRRFTRKRDFDGDGIEDFLWVNQGTYEMWLWWGYAAYTLAPYSPTAGMLGARHIADFNGDGRADILWRGGAGLPGYHLDLIGPNGSRLAGPVLLRDDAWTPQVVGDFNGDARADIVWKHRDGRVEIALMDGAAVLETRMVQPAGSPFNVVQAEDFNADGKTDVLWHAADGRVIVWLMNGVNFTASRTLQAAGGTGQVTHTADLNGDGKADLVWVHADGRTVLTLMDGVNITATHTSQPAGSAWRVTHSGDLNCDGKADLLWRHQTGGNVVGWLMDGVNWTASRTLHAAGSGWSIAHVGYYDIDHCSDIVWKHADGTNFLTYMSGLNYYSQLTMHGPAWTLHP